MSDLPDYYGILEVAPDANGDDIKRAYRKAALKWHPDRVPADSPERPKRTKMFQRINDAYYTLSDATRRKDYDDTRRFHGTADSGNDYEEEEEDAEYEIPRPAPSAEGSWWANMFGFGRPAEATQDESFANDQFKGAFEEMMEEEKLADNNHLPTRRFWSIVGGFSGAVLGFIFGDLMGVVPGAIAGGKAGAIRDAKGKSVYQVFQSLDQNQKARILSDLAAKLFSGALS